MLETTRLSSETHHLHRGRLLRVLDCDRVPELDGRSRGELGSESDRRLEARGDELGPDEASLGEAVGEQGRQSVVTESCAVFYSRFQDVLQSHAGRREMKAEGKRRMTLARASPQLLRVVGDLFTTEIANLLHANYLGLMKRVATLPPSLHVTLTTPFPSSFASAPSPSTLTCTPPGYIFLE